MQLLRVLILLVLTVLALTVGFVFAAAFAAAIVIYFVVRLLMFKLKGKKLAPAGPATAAPRRNVAAGARGDVIEVEAKEVPVAPPPALEK